MPGRPDVTISGRSDPSSALKGVDVVKRGADNLRACFRECGRLGAATGEAGDLVACTKQFQDGGGANPSGGTCYKYMHITDLPTDLQNLRTNRIGLA